jgi:hypothetical protein
MTKAGQVKTATVAAFVALVWMTSKGGRGAVRQHGGWLRGVEKTVRR